MFFIISNKADEETYDINEEVPKPSCDLKQNGNPGTRWGIIISIGAKKCSETN